MRSTRNIREERTRKVIKNTKRNFAKRKNIALFTIHKIAKNETTFKIRTKNERKQNITQT